MRGLVIERHNKFGDDVVKCLAAHRPLSRVFRELPVDTDLLALDQQGQSMERIDRLALPKGEMEGYLIELSVGNSRQHFEEKSDQAARYLNQIFPPPP